MFLLKLQTLQLTHIREELVMSLKMTLGSKPNIFNKPKDNKSFRLELDQPIITNEEIESILKYKNLLEES